MIKRIHYTISLLATLFMLGCSESLEETYEEYAGDGMIRYVGKCTDVEVTPGWERLRVVWKNNIDPGIKRVKITWKSENETTPKVRYIDRVNGDTEGDLMDTIYLEDLQDAMYTVRVNNIAADSSESLVEEKYGRPYSRNHEDLRAFTRGISFFSRMGDKLAVVLDQDNENVKELQLSFFDTEGQEHLWDIKSHMHDTLAISLYGMDFAICRDYMFLLPEDPGKKIDFARPITVKRKGMLIGCVDEIEFEDEELYMNERLWSTAFSQMMLGKYGSNWEDEVNHIETLELDYDLGSMQELMYFPNLEKVILGKNRYMLEEHTRDFMSETNEYVGLLTLAFLQETRENFTVERYNNHYFYETDEIGFGYTNLELLQMAEKIGDGLVFNEQKSANLDAKPNYVSLDTTGWEVTCSDTLFNGYADNGVAWLLYDGPRHVIEDYGWWVEEYDEEVYFEPAQTLGASIITVTFDMKSVQNVQGFKIGQPSRNEKGDTDYLLSSMKVEFSADGYAWTNATHTDGSVTLGNSPGEETFVPVPKDLQIPVRYIRLTMNNRPVSTISGLGVFNLRLGKFIPCIVQ